jgi:hypothetical protein
MQVVSTQQFGPASPRQARSITRLERYSRTAIQPGATNDRRSLLLVLNGKQPVHMIFIAEREMSE